MIVKAYERMCYGYIDTRVFSGTRPIDEPSRAPPPVGDYLWPFEAEQRGYDMALFTAPYMRGRRV